MRISIIRRSVCYSNLVCLQRPNRLIPFSAGQKWQPAITLFGDNRSGKFVLLCYNIARYYSSSSVEKDDVKEAVETVITPELIKHLERTSLVGFGSEEAVTRLEEAIKFANVLFEVDTTGVEPMCSVLENQTIFLREDVPEETNREDVISNAAIVEEDYFVAPPGNIPLDANQLSDTSVHRKDFS